MSKILSIIIPVYNTEKLLPKCLDSILKSKYVNLLDILVVVDGSPDNSYDVAIQYELSYPESIRVVMKENGGHGSTINKGISLAEGKYFKVLDSDDWVDTTQFNLFIDNLKDCDADLVLNNYSKEEVFHNKSISFNFDNICYNKLYYSDDFDYTLVSGEKFRGDQFLLLPTITYKTSVLKASGLNLLEKCFYVDIQYSLFVYPYVKTLIFFDNNVYKYFIGRPEQSIAPESVRRNIGSLFRVIDQCKLFYTQLIANPDMSLSKKSYLLLELTDKFAKIYGIYIKFFPVKESIQILSDYTSELKNTFPDIFNRLKCFRSYRFYANFKTFGLIAYFYYMKLKN